MRIHHLALRTRDVARLAGFYAGVLGFAPRPGAFDERRIWLSIGEAVLMIERADDDEPAVPVGSMDLIAFAVSEEERERVAQHLAAAGIEVEARTEHTRYFRDPDGRRVAISSYPL